MPLEEEHDGRYQMRDSRVDVPDGGLPCNRREPAALLHRGEEPRPPQSTQHSSDDRRRAHPATEGSRGSAAPEGEPRPMLKKQRDATDGGTLTASEGSCGSAAPEGRVPLAA